MSEGPRHFLVDLGFAKGERFMEELLQTGEFTPELMRVFGIRNKSKADAADALRAQLDEDPDLAEDVLLRLCQVPRTWLYFAQLPAGAEPKISRRGTASAFLSEFGSDGKWFGPFEDSDSDACWYVRTQSVNHVVTVTSGFEGEEDTVKMLRVRWHVVAMVTPEYIAIHWNNFSHQEKKSRVGQSGDQFPYWEHIPGIRKEFLELLNLDPAEVGHPKLNDLVLNTLIDKYETNPAYKWEHLRVRAEQYGVAMNAKSGSAKVSEHDIGGLRRLTTALAKSAARAVGKAGDSTTETAIEQSLLRTFIREWGTLSYEFELTKVASEAVVFRGHVYFGQRAKLRPKEKAREKVPDKPTKEEKGRDWGPDSFVHCKCLQKSGGSRGVLHFFMAHL